MDTLLDLPLDDDLRGPRLLLLPDPSLGWSAAQGDLWPFSCPVGGTTHFTVHLQKERCAADQRGHSRQIKGRQKRFEGQRDIAACPAKVHCRSQAALDRDTCRLENSEAGAST